MHGVLHRVRDLGDDLVARWHELAGRALEPNPFFEPEMAVPAARHLAGGHDDVLLAVHDGDALAFALPIRRIGRYRRLRVPAALSWGHDHCYLGTPLVAPERPDAAVAAALDALRAAGVRLLVLERAAADGPVDRLLAAAAPAGGRTLGTILRYERPVVERRPEATYLAGRLSASRRKRLRRQRRGLAAELGEPVVARDLGSGDGLQDAVDRFLAIEAAGWKGRAGTALACDPAASRFFRESMAAFGRQGRAQVWALEAGGVTVAGLCAIEGGPGVFHLKIAHDEAYARFSPGMQLELDVLEAFHHDHAAGWIDSCTSSDPSPSSLLYPDRRTVQTVLLPLDGVRAAAAVQALRAGVGLRERIRERR